MKNIIIALILTATFCLAQGGQAPPNSMLPNFKPFGTPRTNCRPGTIYRTDKNNVTFIVKDLRSIKGLVSKEGTLIGQMTFSKEELLEILNLYFDLDFVTAEVEIKNAEREFTEQTNVDFILWEEGNAEDLMTDEQSKYYVIRETIKSKQMTFRFNEISVSMLMTGKSSLKKKEGKNGVVIDFPYSIVKKFKEPKRLFYLEEKISKNEEEEDE